MGQECRSRACTKLVAVGAGAVAGRCDCGSGREHRAEEGEGEERLSQVSSWETERPHRSTVFTR